MKGSLSSLCHMSKLSEVLKRERRGREHVLFLQAGLPSAGASESAAGAASSAAGAAAAIIKC